MEDSGYGDTKSDTEKPDDVAFGANRSGLSII